ncbi:MFS transporter [Brachymonas denitrificans]|uniref:MFS transporter n=1 Tax=Brachymonas denitrificans TaxID=28220 RepID=UPI001BCF074E|nr:MFS transporter [Brachymonas denitrificans]
MSLLDRRGAILVFLVCAFCYFLSTLLRVVTATIAPQLTDEFQLGAGALGLLSGAYFLGFTLTQLPLGHWLDKLGPRAILSRFLVLAVLGTLLFAWAQGLGSLFAARLLAGIGLSACLMAPLAGYRRWLDGPMQLRANAWMLMTGSFGMVAATLPVQWLLPVTGWRLLFVALAILMALAMLLVLRVLPAWQLPSGAPVAAGNGRPGLRAVWTHPQFIHYIPIALVNYGAMTATQTLWAGPWLSHVAGFTPEQSARGMFIINLLMLLAFWLWGLLMPRLLRAGMEVESMIRRGLPVSMAILLLVILGGTQLGDATPWLLAAFCVTSTVVSLAQPVLTQRLPVHLAGRSLTSFNLLVFAGVFLVQSGVGRLVDALQQRGWQLADAYRGAFGVLLAACVLSYLLFLWYKPGRVEVSSLQ